MAANATHKSCVHSLMKACYRTVGIIHFYTLSSVQADDEPDGVMIAGQQQEEEPYRLKCWTLKMGGSVVDAAAMVDIHIAR